MIMLMGSLDKSHLAGRMSRVDGVGNIVDSLVRVGANAMMVCSCPSNSSCSVAPLLSDRQTLLAVDYVATRNDSAGSRIDICAPSRSLGLNLT